MLDVTEPVISADKLTKVYRAYRKQAGLIGAVRGLFAREYDEIRAADGVSFDIHSGELVGFLGPNGAGKTTVLKMLSGLLVPTSGQAKVLGFVPWERKAEFKRQFSLVLGQKNALWWDLPARESLELNRAIYEIDPVTFRRITDELVDLLAVRDKLSVMVRELSLGERMKMELISALIHSPRILFLDEPTIGLDVVSQKVVRDFLREYAARREIALILTSHYMQDIEELCRRVIVIDHGRVFYDGELAGIVERLARSKILQFTFQRPYRYQGTDAEVIEQNHRVLKLRIGRDRVAAVCQQILATGEVQDFSVEDESIEEIIRQLFAAHAQERLEQASSIKH
jgi:ABC-2 type transport system ATP-binding protein